MNPEKRRNIEAAIRREEKLLIRWLTKKLGDPDAAQDVAQNVFMRVWAFAEVSEIENPRALIFKTAANLLINEMKRRNRFIRRHISPGEFANEDVLHNIASSTPSPEAQACLREDVALTLRTISELPAKPRQAFVMSRFEGLSYREIAKALRVSESSIEKYMIAALKQLRQAVKPDAPKEDNVIELSFRAKNKKSS